MTASDRKPGSIHKINIFRKSQPDELYSVIIKFINGRKQLTDWESPADSQTYGICYAI